MDTQAGTPASLLDIKTDLKEKLGSGAPVIKPPKYDKVVWNRIQLNKGISRTNFYTSWGFVMYLGFIMISFSTLEPQFLIKHLDIDDDDLGKITANLYLSDYMVRCCCAFVYGYMIDHFGRKIVMTIGLVLTSIGYFVIPLFGGTLVGYYFSKAVFSAGIIALQMLPFAADYVHNTTKGIMTCFTFGVGFLGGGLGALALQCLRLLKFSYDTMYYILALFLLVAGLLLRLGIKGGNHYYKHENAGSLVQIEPQNDTTSKWKEAKIAIIAIPWISISMIFGILGNTDLYIMTTGLIIWVKSFIPADYDPAGIVPIYQEIFFGLSFIIAVYLAFKVDRISHMKVIFPVLIGSTFGFCFVPFIRDPHGVLTYLFFIIEGLALPGVLVYSTYLAARYSPPHIRGTISGISNSIGFVGAILILTIGGYLHDYWRKDAGFLIYWGLLVLTLLYVTILYVLKIRSKYTDEDYKSESSQTLDEDSKKGENQV